MRADHDSQSLRPSVLHEFLYLLLAAREAPFAILRFEDESFEVAKVVENETYDFAGDAVLCFFKSGMPFRSGFAGRGRQDEGRITT